ncbi:MAG: PEP-CTERM sorting domain-containing protein [Sedimentisphaerales bacterium]|nr:PEP-CTERM sorting domain-containing protein [Sedimentisphaerales bacterium]
MFKKVVEVCLCIGLWVGVSWADYDNPPAWDNNDPSFTHQVWEFGTDANPANPDVDDNPFGTSTVTIASTGAMWIDDAAPILAELGLPTTLTAGRTGGWAVGDLPGLLGGNPQDVLGGMSVVVPNAQDLTKTKYVWMQVTYFLLNPTPTPFQYITDLQTSPSADINIISEISRPVDPVYQPYWNYYEVLWEIDPQPNQETINVGIFVPGGALFAMDELAIDTICVPEPITLSLLGVGVLFLRRKK